MKITTVGIDLAKSVFQMHGVDQKGKPALQRRLERQHSSGGRVLLQGISKRGDAYLRTLLIHGARSVIRIADRKSTPTDQWSTAILARRHKNIAAVARATGSLGRCWHTDAITTRITKWPHNNS